MRAYSFLCVVIVCVFFSHSKSQAVDYQKIKNRFQTEYVRSFSGIRYAGMGLQENISSEDQVMAFIDGYSYTKHIIHNTPEKRALLFVLSRDSRPTGESILAHQVHGMVKAAEEEGVSLKYINLDIATTPLWESAVREFKADGGIMVTASHNPLHENGWKYADSWSNGGSLLDPQKMKEIISHANNLLTQVVDQEKDISDITDASPLPQPEEHQFDQALAAYMREQSIITEGIDRSIVAINDPNGGAAARVNTLALARLGFKNVRNINIEIGKPNHKIEPVKGRKGEENDRTKNALLDVSKALLTTKAKVAIVYDFDADRGNLVLLDHNGTVDEISPQDVAAFNVAMALLSYRKEENGKKLAVVGHCATSGRVKEIAQRLGAEFFTVEVGEVNVSKKMIALEQEGYIVPIGVEGYNGGTIFKGSQCRDGLQTLLVAMKALSNPNIFFSWLDIQGINPSNSLLKRISEGEFYLTDFLAYLPRYESIQEKKTGIRLDQKQFKKSLERAFANTVTYVPAVESYRLSTGRLYREIFVEYSSETETRSRPYNSSFIPGQNLDGSFIEGGWRIRLVDSEGHESTLWIRGSKTENGTYRTLADARTPQEAKELNLLLNSLFEQASE